MSRAATTLALVALLAEGVDRNANSTRQASSNYVALLAEGVDRNLPRMQSHRLGRAVALLAEGVDRNAAMQQLALSSWLSPSSRRAWIEIRSSNHHRKETTLVALLAEGVDRNNEVGSSLPEVSRRPPRGGRG